MLLARVRTVLVLARIARRLLLLVVVLVEVLMVLEVLLLLLLEVLMVVVIVVVVVVVVEVLLLSLVVVVEVRVLRVVKQSSWLLLLRVGQLRASLQVLMGGGRRVRLRVRLGVSLRVGRVLLECGRTLLLLEVHVRLLLEGLRSVRVNQRTSLAARMLLLVGRRRITVVRVLLLCNVTVRLVPSLHRRQIRSVNLARTKLPVERVQVLRPTPRLLLLARSLQVLLLLVRTIGHRWARVGPNERGVRLRLLRVLAELVLPVACGRGPGPLCLRLGLGLGLGLLVGGTGRFDEQRLVVGVVQGLRVGGNHLLLLGVGQRLLLASEVQLRVAGQLVVGERLVHESVRLLLRLRLCLCLGLRLGLRLGLGLGHLSHLGHLGRLQTGRRTESV